MGWLKSILNGIFSGLAQGVLALFGMSDAQKLGRADVTQKNQAATIKELEDAKTIRDRVESQPSGAANDWLHSHHIQD